MSSLKKISRHKKVSSEKVKIINETIHEMTLRERY
jgi:hypothetical protein